MNTATRSLTHLTMIVAAAAAAFVAQPSHAADAADEKLRVVHLERVVITGKRLPAATSVAVVHLPRVVITGRRLPAEATLLAAKNQAGVQAF